MAGIFGGLFDFNHDGKLDTFEKAAEFATFACLIHAMESEKVSTGFGVDDNEEDELEMAGLNRDELEYMDEDERREAMEDAGLDPDNYDF